MILFLKTRICESRRRSSNGKLFLFLDIIKAYDSVWIKGLLHKMKSMGIPIFFIKLISVWLANRFAYAKSGSKRSTLFQLFKGLPQGGVLCCILWAIYINDLPDFILSLCHYILFADDVQLSPLNGGEDGIIQIQKALVAVCTWANKWRVKWSASKSTYMSVNISVSPSLVTLYDTLLKEADFSKYLGLTFDKDGSWKHHWSAKLNKAKQTANLIQKFTANSSTSVPAAFTALLCRQVLQAAFFYGFPIWSPPDSHFSTADEVVIKPFSKVIGIPWNAGILLGYIEAGLMPLAFYWDYSALLFGRRIFRHTAAQNVTYSAILKDFNGTHRSSLIRGSSPLGYHLKWLEGQWSVSISHLSLYQLKNRRQIMFKKFVSSYNSSSSSALMFFRETGSLLKIPAYLFLPRAFAKCVLRFRINYGPDIASLQRRGLLRDMHPNCRLCGKEKETRQHLLCECVFTRKKIPLSWRGRNLSFFISDKTDDDKNFYRKVAYLKGIADALYQLS